MLILNEKVKKINEKKSFIPAIDWKARPVWLIACNKSEIIVADCWPIGLLYT